MNFKKRIQKVAKLVQKNGLKSYLVTDPTDLYYLTGLELSSGMLLISQEENSLIVDGRYYEACKTFSPVPTYLLDKDMLVNLLKGANVLGIDSGKTTVAAYLNLKEKLQISIEPTSGILEKVRAVKDSEELKKMQAAANLGVEGFEYVKTLLKEGVQEKEIALALDIFWKTKGAQGVAFEPIIAFGAHGSMPHYRAGEARYKKGEAVLIDIGVKLDHYNSDMTRTLVFEHQELKKIHAIVQEALERAQALLKPGVCIADVDDAARSFIADKGYGEQFTHSLGHGIGLDVHEFPTIRRNAETASLYLEAGMTITIEPGIYLPKVGGVRIEDTVVITEHGYENLTKVPHA